jgi:hypothetical protein
MKSLSVAYNIPKLLSKARGRIYLQAANLLTFTPYKGTDPENQSILSLPPLKTITAGFAVIF